MLRVPVISVWPLTRLIFGVLLLSFSIVVAQEPNQIQLEQSVYILGTDGEVVEITAGEYSVTKTESESLTLAGETATYRIRGVQYDHDEELDLVNAVSFSPAENEHHILLLNPDGTGLLATGSHSDVATRAARPGTPMRTAAYRANVKVAINRNWNRIAARPYVRKLPARIIPTADNRFTIINNSTGGECNAMGQGVSWNNSAKECVITDYTLEAGKTLEIRAGAVVRVRGDFQSHGKITNDGLLLIGYYPPAGDPVTSAKLFADTITNFGLVENRSAAKIQCFTRAMWLNEERTTSEYGGRVVNDGVTMFDCRLTHRGKEIVNNGKMFFRYGTQEQGQHHSRAMPADQGKNLWGLTINRDEIWHHKSVGVDNRSTVENFGKYAMSSGAWFENMLLDSHFYNICNGSSPGLVITGKARDPSWTTENRDAPQYIDTPRIELKPCDADNDGIPDGQDQCPNQPEIYNGLLDSDGCPDAGGTGP